MSGVGFVALSLWMWYDEDLTAMAYGCIQAFIDDKGAYDNFVIFLCFLGSYLMATGIMGIAASFIANRKSTAVVRMRSQ